MRAIVNISLPQPMLSLVEREMAEGKYASKSEFFRDILRDWSEAKLARELKEAHNEMVRGKKWRLKSLKDLR